MSIEIKGTGDRQLRGAEHSTAARPDSRNPTAEKASNGPSSTRDTVSLTETANQLSKLESVVADLPVVDTQRVEAMKQALLSKSYQIDPDRVADKLIGFETELNTKT